jgi:hypothetical protein
MLRRITRVLAGLIVGLAFGSASGADPQKPLSTVVDKGTVTCEQCLSNDVCTEKCQKGADRCQYGCSATDKACNDPCSGEHQRCTKWCADLGGKCSSCPGYKK